MFRYLMLVSVIVMSFLTAPAATACTCIPNAPPQESLEAASFVFAGRVLRIRNASEDEYPESLDVTLQVERPFKGFFTETVTVRTANNSAACGFPFKKGERYLVYTEESGEANIVRVSLCSRTAQLQDARDDLDAFDAIDLLEEVEEQDGGRCGGPTNIAALQAMLFVFFVVAIRAVGRGGGPAGKPDESI